MINAGIKEKIELLLKEKIIYSTPLSGGSISTAYKVDLSNGKSVFLKISPQFPDMFVKEANGLRELQKANAIRIPNVFYSDNEILLLEYISLSRTVNQNKFFKTFGYQYARLHKFSAHHFGFFEDNYIGSTPQKNTLHSSWKEFFIQERLIFQFTLAKKNNFVDQKLSSLFEKLLSIIDSLIPQNDEKPSLLHGDLWSGNFLSDENGNPVLIDPAVYYGDREADLAMTLLFGGFDEAFYSAYNEKFPLREGWKVRMELYKLYHLFNHLNLFGLGYYSQVHSTIRFLLQ